MFSSAGIHPEKKFRLQISTQGKTVKKRPISKVKIAKQMRSRRGVREDRRVSPEGEGTDQESRPTPASGTCEKLALLRNALGDRIAGPNLVAAQVPNRLEAEPMQRRRAQTLERGEVLGRAIAFIVLKPILRKHRVPSLQRGVPGHFGQNRRGGDRKAQRVAMNQCLLWQRQVDAYGVHQQAIARRRQLLHGTAHGQTRGLQNVRSGRSRRRPRRPRPRTAARSRIRSARTSRRSGASCLLSSRPADRFFGIEDHGCGEDRAEEGSAAGFVQPRRWPGIRLAGKPAHDGWSACGFAGRYRTRVPASGRLCLSSPAGNTAWRGGPVRCAPLQCDPQPARAVGKIRSTPWPKLTLRTVMVRLTPLLCWAITVPSNACNRSLSPSLIFTCTRMVSPGRNSGWPLRLVPGRDLRQQCVFHNQNPSSMISQTGDPFSQILSSSIDRAAAARFFPAPPSAATAGFPHGFRPAALPEPSSREIPPAWYIAGNPAGRPLRTTRNSAESLFPSTPSFKRATTSMTIAAASSPPLNTKSPTESSSSAKCSATRSSTPS